MNKQALQQMMASKEWETAIAILDKHLEALWPTDGLEMEEIGKRYLAAQLAKTAKLRAMNELKLMAQEIDKKDISYK